MCSVTPGLWVPAGQCFGLMHRMPCCIVTLLPPLPVDVGKPPHCLGTLHDRPVDVVKPPHCMTLPARPSPQSSKLPCSWRLRPSRACCWPRSLRRPRRSSPSPWPWLRRPSTLCSSCADWRGCWARCGLGDGWGLWCQTSQVGSVPLVPPTRLSSQVGGRPVRNIVRRWWRECAVLPDRCSCLLVVAMRPCSEYPEPLSPPPSSPCSPETASSRPCPAPPHSGASCCPTHCPPSGAPLPPSWTLLRLRGTNPFPAPP